MLKSLNIQSAGCRSPRETDASNLLLVRLKIFWERRSLSHMKECS